jgi:teichuronic acid biosynthesis glycosyltransferase TuaC
MRILIVCSGTDGNLSPFIKEQIDSLTKFGTEFSLYQINRKGFFGYLFNLRYLKRKIVQFKPDIIHAHYGLSGLLANLQYSVPVITTFHGSDINDNEVFKYSKWAHKLSVASIFVEEKMMMKVNKLDKSSIIPCGTDTLVFYSIPKKEACTELGLDTETINILFSSSSCISVKNYPLALKSCNILKSRLERKINLIELKGYTRDQVNLLLNAVDCVLLTSFSEGSPQVIKEAMACNCPIVATDVGDISWLFGDTDGCYLTSFDPSDVAAKINLGIEFSYRIGKTNGRERILQLGLDLDSIALRINEVYKNVMKTKLSEPDKIID